MTLFIMPIVGRGGLGVKCSAQDPRFMGSNLAEVMDFFKT